MKQPNRDLLIRLKIAGEIDLQKMKGMSFEIISEDKELIKKIIGRQEYKTEDGIASTSNLFEIEVNERTVMKMPIICIPLSCGVKEEKK